MKSLRLITALAFTFLLGQGLSLAQNFQGIATYQSARKMNNFSIKGDGMSTQMEEEIKASLKKQMQKEYTLKFNLTESIWKEVESLGDAPATASSGGVMIRVAGGGGLIYKNTAENLFMQETEVFSKPFLVKDELESREWQLTNETKKIGDYTAQKAIWTNIVERKTISFSNEENEQEVTKDTINVEAWFTPQIPVSQGPDDFWGLPGLILEVSNGTTTYICSKIVLNPDEEVEIKQPSRGKKVTREELTAIRDEKTQEMMEKYNSNGNGKGMTIKIGGGE